MCMCAPAYMYVGLTYMYISSTYCTYVFTCMYMYFEITNKLTYVRTCIRKMNLRMHSYMT